MNKLWVCCSFENEYEGKLSKSLLLKASRLIQGHDIILEAVCLTQAETSAVLVKELSLLGVSGVYIWKKDNFNQRDIQYYVRALQKLIKRYQPHYLLFIGTSFYKNTAAQLATSLDIGLTAECTDFYLSEAMELIQVRPTFEGNTFAHIRSVSPLVMATALPVIQNGKTGINGHKDVTVNIIDMTLDGAGCRTDYQDNPAAVQPEKMLSDYDIVFAGGMGLKTKENFQQLQRLAEKYQAGLAASRPAVEMEWAKRSSLVGISGQCIAPKIYVAFGVSGMLQHIEGIRHAQTIISVNLDKEAPIHSLANYVIYEDAAKILTKLLQ